MMNCVVQDVDNIEKMKKVILARDVKAILYARLDSNSGKGMNEGWLVGDGEAYYIKEKDAIDHAIEAGYATLDEAVEDEYIYWSEWEDEEEYEYLEFNGNMYEIEIIDKM